MSGVEPSVSQDAPIAAFNPAKIRDLVASGALLIWLTALMQRFAQLITMVILARLLNPSDYGIVAMAMVVVGLLDLLSNVQAGSALIRTKTVTQAHLDTAFTLNLIRGTASAIVMVLLARPASVFMHTPALQAVLYALSACALFGGLHNPRFFLFARDLNFTQDSRREGSVALIVTLSGIAAALILHNYWALVISSITGAIAWSGLSFWRVPGRLHLDLSKSREILSYGGWLMLIGLLDYVTARADYVLIGRQIGSRSLGAYNVGQVLTNAATGDVVTALSRALFPAFALLSHDPDRLRRGYKQIQSIILAFALPIGFGLSALAPGAVLLMFGPKWSLAVPVIRYLAPIAALLTVAGSVESLALSMDKGGLLFNRSLIFAIAKISMLFVGFHYAGYLGIIYSRVVSGGVLLIYSLFLAGRLTQSFPFDPVLASWRSFVAVGVMWCVLTQLPSPMLASLSILHLAALLAGKVLVGGVVYIGVHAGLWRATGRPDGAERHILRQVMRALSSNRINV